MRNALLLAVAMVVSIPAITVEARREPRRFYRPVRYLTEARVDYAFHVGPPPPTRDQQLRPLPSFAAPPGSPGADGRGVHAGIWQRVRHYDWTQLQRTIRSASVERTTGPKTIVIIYRHPPRAS